MTEAEIVRKLQTTLSPKRFLHTIGVRECAKTLAAQYGGEAEKAETAALLHDCAKPYGKEESIILAKRCGVVFDEFELQESKLMHASLGAALAKDEYGVNDEDILNAIRYHTTGRKKMSLLEKIIYIADFIEPNRHFEGLEHLRETTLRDLDIGVEEGLRLSIRHVGKDTLHPRTRDALHYYQEQNKRRGCHQ